MIVMMVLAKMIDDRDVPDDSRVMMCGDEFWVTPVCYSPQIRLDRLEMHLLFREELNHLLIIKLVKYICYELTCDRKVSKFFTVSILKMHICMEKSTNLYGEFMTLWFFDFWLM